ncbi:hypothetical protein Cni_G02067 [Canna indica]|uniref:Glycosyltransferase 61 catalytic domain-containing protein n=1 Tax=Canna indica TaxID=4628 RepID=A0AAQ3Q1T3_9LILI|nr:hypothetical protein Cni_G02067 [Canna indica]
MAKDFKNFNRAKTQNYGVGLVAVFILLSLTYITMSRTNTMRISVATSQLSSVPNMNRSITSGDHSNGPQKDSLEGGILKPEKKPICDFSNRKSDFCEAEGDVRIIGKDTRMVYVSSSHDQFGHDGGGDSWTLKPYARKVAAASGAGVREVTLKLVNGYHGEDSLRCTVNYTVPAVVFAIGGWTGNFFHDFADVLAPLFQNAYPFNGEVQFLVANMIPSFINKYQPILKKLSRYEIIEYDKDDAIRCFKRVILGLRLSTAEDFQMNPSNSPHGYSMLDLASFVKSVYSLERLRPSRITAGAGGGVEPVKKPRLMLITRARTRRFMNAKEIVQMAEELGFEVVVSEANPDVAKFARIVNSCDVLMGVHGSALTNMVFLPTNGVVIQVVPWGNLDWIAEHYFKEPARQMKVNYIEYSINEEETTLSEMYPRDHAVFKDPKSLHRQGWNTYARIFLREQNVRLDLRRFRPFLERALQILREIN